MTDSYMLSNCIGFIAKNQEIRFRQRQFESSGYVSVVFTSCG